MNKEEFKELMSEDPHSLADLIRENEFTFEFLEDAVSSLNVPKIILGAILSHSDCTDDFFLTNYPIYKKGIGRVGDHIVLPVVKPLKNIDVIAQIVRAKKNTIESIFDEFEYKKVTFKMMAINPHTHMDFKMKYYEKTGDNNVLPPETQDLFIF